MFERPTSTTLNAFLGHWLPRLEAEMRTILGADSPISDEYVAAHYSMMHYHMGWVDEAFRPQQLPTGKRLRPMLCLLACAEAGGDPADALPAAAALELLHNFSLVHDDIEDRDATRHHRPTVWKLWGEPQGINVGDGLFALAFAAMQRLARRGISAPITLQALASFTQTCLELTEGQHLDLGFETRASVTVQEYLRMIHGKTASLVGASVVIGAQIGGASRLQANALQQFGKSVGLTFQIQDDILGIWGDPQVTGKAAGNDILRRKKSLPLLYALDHEIIGPLFRHLWEGDLTPAHLPSALDMLEECGARTFAEVEARKHHDAARRSIHAALGDYAADSALLALAESLLNRRA